MYALENPYDCEKTLKILEQLLIQRGIRVRIVEQPLFLVFSKGNPNPYCGAVETKKFDCSITEMADEIAKEALYIAVKDKAKCLKAHRLLKACEHHLYLYKVYTDESPHLKNKCYGVRYTTYLKTVT